MKRISHYYFFAFFLLSPATSLLGQVEANVEHVKVYYERDMYGGWPANYGIWSWGNEILFGFEKAHHKDRGPTRHSVDEAKPRTDLLARSMDGGRTWKLEDPAAARGLKVSDCSEPINFLHPDLALTVRRENWQSGIFYSYDRGRTWRGPCLLPNMNTPGIAARTDYIIDSERVCTLFLTAAKQNGAEGRVFAARTEDGGITWNFLSWIGKEPSGYAIMPATVRLADGELLTTIRRREGDHSFIEAYRSVNNGTSWQQLSNPTDDTGVGNPPAMIKLRDGRICLAYAYRADVDDIRDGKKTSDIRAKLSSDNGRTWSKEYILRNDGSGRDIGYPRVAQRLDGKIVVVYYFVDKHTGPERYISATIWEPPAPR